MGILEACKIRAKKPKEVAELFVQYPNTKLGIGLWIINTAIIAIVLGTTRYTMNYNIIMLSSVPPILLISALLNFAILRMFRGKGSIINYFSSLGWVGVLHSVSALLFLLAHYSNTQTTTCILYLIIGLIETCTFNLRIVTLSLLMQLSYKKVLFTPILFGIPGTLSLAFIIFALLVPNRVHENYIEIINYNLGTEDYKAGNYSKALKEFDIAIASADKKEWATDNQNKLTAKVLNGKGLTLGAVGKYKEAIDCYNIALNFNYSEAAIHNNKGMATYHIKDYNSAMAEFNKATALNPKDKAAFYNTGVLLVELGRIEEAKESFNKSLKIDPNYIEALEALQSIDTSYSL